MERENSLFPYQPKAPQEEPSRRTAFATEKRSVWEHGFSDEEIEVMPAERVRLEWKSTIRVKNKYLNNGLFRYPIVL